MIAALVSWGIALFEYLLQVPANRIGNEVMNVGQLKILQEVIALSIFVPFSVWYLKEKITLDYLWAGYVSSALRTLYSVATGWHLKPQMRRRIGYSRNRTGSLGDFNPMLGIARHLQRMGRQVLMIGAEPYRELALRAELQFHPLVSSETFYETLEHPDLWDAWRGPRLIFDRLLGESLDRHYQWLEQNCDPARVLLVSHMLDFAGRIYRDRYPECRQASVLLSPSVLRSERTPPQLTSSGFERRLPTPLVRMLYRVADWSVDRLAGKHINRLRRSLGLRSVKGIVNKWWYSPI